MIFGTQQWLDAQFRDAGRTGVDGWYTQVRASQALRHERSLALIKPLLGRAGTQSILDIGAGLGDFTARVHAQNPANTVTGLDPVQSAVAAAARRHPQLSFQQGALPDIRMGQTFDGITALESCYYLSAEARGRAFAAIARLLRPGGWLLFSSPLDDGSTYFTEGRARELIERAGMRIERTEFLHGRLAAAYERGLLGALFLRDGLCGNGEAAQRRFIRPAVAFLARCRNVPVLGPVTGLAVRALAAVAAWQLRRRTPVIILQKIGGALPGRRSRSHILILAHKGA